MIVAADERQDVAGELLQKVLEAFRAHRRRPAQPAGQLRRRATAHHRLVCEPGPPINQQVHCLVTEPSHGLRVEPKWILVHTLPIKQASPSAAGRGRQLVRPMSEPT